MIEKKCIKENIHNLFADNLTLRKIKKNLFNILSHFVFKENNNDN